MSGRVILMRCEADACQQGRRPCPTPSACEVEESEPDFRRSAQEALLVRLIVVVAILGATAAVLWPL